MTPDPRSPRKETCLGLNLITLTSINPDSDLYDQVFLAGESYEIRELERDAFDKYTGAAKMNATSIQAGVIIL